MHGGTALKEVIVVGGGPVGAAAALGLDRAGIRVTVLEARPHMRVDDRRTLAVAHGSRLILQALGVWPDPVAITEIRRIHVSQKGHFGQTLLTAEDARVPALGYVMRYNALVEAQAQALSKSGVEWILGAAVSRIEHSAQGARVFWSTPEGEVSDEARLVVLADGGRTVTTALFGASLEQGYDQVALVAKVWTDKPHRHLAYERFTPAGPVALLPFEHHYALVWTGRQPDVERFESLPDATFLQEFQHYFGDRAGQFLKVEARSWFPLMLRVAGRIVQGHCVCIGNAAQTMHPVAGQGLNLGLRDADTLCRVLGQEMGLLEKGNVPQLLEVYEKQRSMDRRMGIAMTHALVRGFSNDWPLLPVVRGKALMAMNLLPVTRRILSRVMMSGFSAR